MNPRTSRNSANTLLLLFNRSQIMLFFFKTRTNVIQQFPCMTSTPSAWTPSVLTVALAKRVLLETEKSVSVSSWNDYSLLPVVIHFKTKQNQNNPGLIWTLGWKLLYDRLELSPKQCHVQLHMRRDSFANNSHFRSTLALKFKPFSFLCILSDVDECANKSHDCDVNAYCNNTVGSYRCTCNSWYQGNGTSCYFREFN